MRRLVLCVSLLMGSVIAVSEAASTYYDGIAAVVNDQVITVSDVLEETRDQEAKLRLRFSGDKLNQLMNRVRSQAANHLVEQALIYEEFQDKGLTLPISFVEERLDDVVVQKAAGDWEVFYRQLEKRGLDLNEFKEELHRELAIKVFVNRNLRDKVRVSPSEIEQYYSSHENEFKEPRDVKLQRILIKMAGKSRDAVIKKIQNAIQMLNSRIPFGEVAKKLSEGEKAGEGGNIGWVKTSSLPLAVREALASVSKGQIVPPERTVEGMVMYKLLDQRDVRKLPLSEVREQIRLFLEEKEFQKRHDDLIESLKQKFYYEVYF
jgi:parvulin-like peptidyl-prolyl isomerase